MSTVNLLLLAITVGLSVALLQKSKDSKQQQQPAKKNKKKNKKKQAAPPAESVAEKQQQQEVPKPKPAAAKKENVAPKQNGSAKKAKKVTEAKPTSPLPKTEVTPPAQAWTNESLRKKHLAGTSALAAQLDDMRDEEVDPTPSYDHVARIPAPAPSGPRAVELTAKDVQDGWESVGVSQRPKSSSSTNANGGGSFASIASTNPFSALDGPKVRTLPSASAPAKAKASSWTVAGGHKPKPPTEEPSKKQRQNAAKTAAKKEAREAEEQERLARLARHRGEQEREKARAATAKPPTPYVVKKASPRAALNEKGALIWE